MSPCPLTKRRDAADEISPIELFRIGVWRERLAELSPGQCFGVEDWWAEHTELEPRFLSFVGA
jgi:hypothetical protein